MARSKLFYVSYSRNSRFFSRESVEVVECQNGRGRPNERIKFRLVDQKGSRGKITRLLKIFIKEDVNLEDVMMEIVDWIGDDRLVIGGMLEGKSWINGIFDEMCEVKRQVESAKKNGENPSTIKFLKRLETMLRNNFCIDFGIQEAELLQDEIRNFQRGFKLAY